MDFDFLATLIGTGTLIVSWVYQIGVTSFAKSEVKKNNGNIAKNVEVAKKKLGKLSTATQITFGVLTLVYILTLIDKIFDNTKARLSVLEDKVLNSTSGR